MFNFPNPFSNWSNDLNQATINISGFISEKLEVNKRELEKLFIDLGKNIMADLQNLKDAISRNEAGISELGVKLSEVGTKVASESQEIKELIDTLKSKINIDVAEITTEIARLDASSQKLAQLGSDIETIGGVVSDFVVPEVVSEPTPIPVESSPAPSEPTPAPETTEQV